MHANTRSSKCCCSTFQLLAVAQSQRDSRKATNICRLTRTDCGGSHRAGCDQANATPAQKDAAVQAYLQLKLQGGVPTRKQSLARKQVEANEEALNAASSGAIRGRKLGNTVSVRLFAAVQSYNWR